METSQGAGSMQVVVLRADCDRQGIDGRLDSEGVPYRTAEIGPGLIAVGLDCPRPPAWLLDHPAFERSVSTPGPYAFVSRELIRGTSAVKVGPLTIGGGTVAVIAGPCAVESRAQIEAIAPRVAAAGAQALRGGAFKPRTSPYSFQGLGREGLEILAEAREATGLPIVTEVMSAEELPLVEEFADFLQVGSRNIQNFRLLEAVGASRRPVLLKRGMASTLDEFLAAAEYVWLRGNRDIVLCERGIRGFEPRMRNVLDLGAVALLKRLTHLPVVVDPSHACGLSELVPDLARAAVAVGADGLLVEVHPRPELALSDGRQSLTLSAFVELMDSLGAVAAATGRPLAAPIRKAPSRSAAWTGADGCGG